MPRNQSKNKQSVEKTFEMIAKDWDRLRGNPWPVLVSFLNEHSFSKRFFRGLTLDLGCGNGRHSMLFAEESDYVIGVDLSFKLLKIAREKCSAVSTDNISYVRADVSVLPFKSKTIDRIIFLATLHHIPGGENRLKTVKALEKVLKIKGMGLISVWRKWQKRFYWHFLKEGIKNIFTFHTFKEFGDVFVPWKQQNGIEVQRFYHLFSRRELKKLLKKTELQIILLKNFGGPTKRDNIFAVLEKK